MELSSYDYQKIGRFYGIPKQNNKTYKDLAEGVLADKLCKCIKKVRPKNAKLGEKRAISVCRGTIFKKRHIDLYKFKCKNGPSLISKKGTKKKLRKFRKTIGFNKTKRSKKNK
tara:strand:+ start:778 stop:1116 length:339 start_codon:yes stop_codon:yes gene_type:complete